MEDIVNSKLSYSLLQIYDSIQTLLQNKQTSLNDSIQFLFNCNDLNNEKIQETDNNHDIKSVILLKINTIIQKQNKKCNLCIQSIQDEFKQLKTIHLIPLLTTLHTKAIDIHFERLIYFQNTKIILPFYLLMKYPSSTIYKSLIDRNDRTDTNDIYNDYIINFISILNDYIVHNSKEYLQRIQQLSNSDKNLFCHDLLNLNIPLTHDLFGILYNNDNKYGIEWKNRCTLNKYNILYYTSLLYYVDIDYSYLNNNNDKEMNRYIIDIQDFDLLIDINMYIEHYHTNEVFIKSNYSINQIDSFMNSKNFNRDNKMIQNYLSHYTSLLFYKSKILENNNYDKYINEWFGHEYKWKLLYRSSEHYFTGLSFHRFCDNKGPTLIIIKSSEGWLFGGFTIKSWRGDSDLKYDSKAFIFTLNNPHHIPPTKYNILKECKYVINCVPQCGPIFRNVIPGSDICIGNKCNQPNSCWIENNGNLAYECDSQYRKSLFVNTDEPDERNDFSVLDYEVYTFENYHEFIRYGYQCGELILNYIETHRINTSLIPKECSEHDLLSELSDLEITINSESQDILFNYYYTPSNVLIKSHIVDKEYDQYINEWFGQNNKWKLLYRASEHNYTAESFHEYCNYRTSTLIIIKSSEGWIFGGFTTKSWSGNDEFKDDSNAFIFTLKNPHNIPPTKYNKRKESEYAIQCSVNGGPLFRGTHSYDIVIRNNCNQPNSSFLDNNGTHGYECNSEYRNSLFVNTDGPDSYNNYSVFDYEVYGIDK